MKYCIFVVVAFASILSVRAQDDTHPVVPADIIFVGSNIITVDRPASDVEAVAVRGAEIVAVGSRHDVMAFRASKTRIVELGEHALLPGFIDAHGHVTAVARILDFVDLSAPPVGTTRSIADIVSALRRRLRDKPIEPNGWLVGFGYDESLLAENRHPTRDDLDTVSASVPILLIHASGHLATINSAALEAASISTDTDNPPGGIIRRRAGSRVPNGVLEETAATSVIAPRLYSIRGDELVQRTRQAIATYLRQGITTIQDGAAIPADVVALSRAAAITPFAADVAAYVLVEGLSAAELEQFQYDRDYTNGFRVAGAKMILDGSVQGLTAWLSIPYKKFPEGQSPDYRAYPRMDIARYQSIASNLLKRKIPILVHANGDAAIDAMLDGIEKAGPPEDHRSVIIHAQVMRKDQMERAAKLGTIISFFSAHPFFWGDWHREILGDDRAQNISATQWAMEAGIPWTIHNDAPIVPPDMMRLISITVNRRTRSGYVLGEYQRASVAQALYAATLGAAYQYFEEGRKGSITAGKQADLVILESNPLTADPDDLADIAIVETFARGISVYTSEHSVAGIEPAVCH